LNGSSKFEYLRKPEFAVDYLADRLIDGTLILFLGAGASRGFGLPGWTEFVTQFTALAGIDNDLTPDSTADQKERALDVALRKINHDHAVKIKLIRKILYPDPSPLDARTVFSQRLLIAISSLLIARKRGHINRVVTFNYDNMLEWFLAVFGLAVRPIYQIPALEGTEDVRIYHPHGYVPHPTFAHKNSNSLIVGSKDANGRAGDANSLWWHKERDLLRTGIGLFVGLSLDTFRDRAVQPHLREVCKELSEMNERPLGLWVFINELTAKDVDECLDYGIIPIELHSEEDVTDFILNISQKALKKVGDVCS
jgi:hypothetical protein